MKETTELRALGDVMERVRQNNAILLGIVEDHLAHPEDRRKASDAIDVNMHTMVKVVRYMDQEPSFQWYLVETPIRWKTAMFEHLPTLQTWSIHT